MSKPVIFFVDDEPHNLTVFEAALPDKWEVLTYENPLEALEALETHTPWVIVTDQRMPNITGVKFLELARKIHPSAVRIIVTGYSDESQIVESVRKAQVFDYILKPWDPDDLEASVQRAITHYEVSNEKELLLKQLQEREAELEKKNLELFEVNEKLEKARVEEETVRKELECWVPPYVTWALQEKVQFPVHSDLIGITFDIVQSSKLHGVEVNGKPLRNEIIRSFTESLIRHGGWRESHSGDSAYGHFGLMESDTNPYEAALAVVSEFKVALRNFSRLHGKTVEAGLALHVAKRSLIDVHTAKMNTPQGEVIQKSFDTSSTGIDVLHRMEKLVHTLPGTNVLMSEEFRGALKDIPYNLVPVGSVNFPGRPDPCQLHLIPSDLLTEEKIEEFRKLLKKKASSEEAPVKEAA